MEIELMSDSKSSSAACLASFAALAKANWTTASPASTVDFPGMAPIDQETAADES